MNKQIQLRGISRTPSDRMSADGGCAESLNVILKDGELSPMPGMDDITRREFGEGALSYVPVYIHKTEEYANYILLDGKRLIVHDDTEEGAEVFVMNAGENLKEIKSVGNTLLILTDKRLEYVLYKSGRYHDLGEHLPEPKIRFEYKTIGIPIAYKGASIDVNATEAKESDKLMKEIDHPSLVCGSGDGADAYNFYNQRLKPELQAAYRSVLKANRAYGQLSSAVSLRYAYKMYNGQTHACHSAPVMIDPLGFVKYDSFTYVGLYRTTYDDGSARFLISRDISTSDGMPNVLQAYELSIVIDDGTDENNLSDWSDIIQSVDFFTTGEYDFTNFELYSVSDKQETQYGNLWVKLNMKATTESQYLDKIMREQFYKFHSIPIKDYKAGTIAITDLEDWDPDILVTKDRLKNDVSGTNDTFTPMGIEVYNKRMLMSGAIIKHTNGYHQLPSVINTDNKNNQYIIRYIIGTENGTDVVVSRSYDISNGSLGPWLFYPSVRCYKAEVYCKVDNGYKKKDIVMTEHPYLNGAYGFAGLSVNWKDGEDAVHIPTYNQPYESRANRLYQSVSENPFVIENERSFTGELRGTAVITKPLSTGQFGYASIYAFTSDGLYAVATESDGSLGKMDPVSQDVATKGTICQLDQAIAFTTKKGVMLLRGSELNCISDKMNGRCYKMEEEMANMLTGTPWENLSQLLCLGHQLTFREFIQEAKTVYDYAGNRLLFFSSTEDAKYAYVYMLSDDSWHKLPLDNNMTFVNILNSYPDAYISVSKPNSPDDNYPYHLMSCSEVVNPESEECIDGIIVTRPLAFDADDVRKVINHLMVRGAYEKSHVQYILQASMDGIRWARLGSLRGGSYNLFRVIILTHLHPSETVSYIDIDYETRFANRMR